MYRLLNQKQAVPQAPQKTYRDPKPGIGKKLPSLV